MIASTDPGEVEARTRDWLLRAVIGLNLCPFAKAVYVKGQVRIVVTAAALEDELLEMLGRELEFLVACDPEEVDTTLLVHPLALAEFHDYRLFLARADRLVRKSGQEGTIQIAGFHPRFEFADSAPDDIGNFTNRSPYPMLHLLREASVTRATAAFPDAQKIVASNISTLQSLGLEGWHALGLD